MSSYDTCGKIYSPNSLQRHEVIHLNNPTPFECEFCEKKFGEISLVIQHERVHSGEKPYQCKYCEKTFAKKYDHNQHERVHTDLKPFNCTFLNCEKKYSRRDDLNQHIFVKHKSKPAPISKKIATEYSGKKKYVEEMRIFHPKVKIRRLAENEIKKLCSQNVHNINKVTSKNKLKKLNNTEYSSSDFEESNTSGSDYCVDFKGISYQKQTSKLFDIDKKKLVQDSMQGLTKLNRISKKLSNGRKTKIIVSDISEGSNNSFSKSYRSELSDLVESNTSGSDSNLLINYRKTTSKRRAFLINKNDDQLEQNSKIFDTDKKKLVQDSMQIFCPKVKIRRLSEKEIKKLCSQNVHNNNKIVYSLSDFEGSNTSNHIDFKLINYQKQKAKLFDIDKNKLLKNSMQRLPKQNRISKELNKYRKKKFNVSDITECSNNLYSKYYRSELSDLEDSTTSESDSNFLITYRKTISKRRTSKRNKNDDQLHQKSKLFDIEKNNVVQDTMHKLPKQNRISKILNNDRKTKFNDSDISECSNNSYSKYSSWSGSNLSINYRKTTTKRRTLFKNKNDDQLQNKSKLFDIETKQLVKDTMQRLPKQNRISKKLNKGKKTKFNVSDITECSNNLYSKYYRSELSDLEDSITSGSDSNFLITYRKPITKRRTSIRNKSDDQLQQKSNLLDIGKNKLVQDTIQKLPKENGISKILNNGRKTKFNIHSFTKNSRSESSDLVESNTSGSDSNYLINYQKPITKRRTSLINKSYDQLFDIAKKKLVQNLLQILRPKVKIRRLSKKAIEKLCNQNVHNTKE